MVANTCAICNGSDTKLCSSCHSISYCPEECQKTDWPLHKTICKGLTNLLPRPSPSHKLAILFPVDSKKPKIIWVNCEHQTDDEYGIQAEWERADIHSILETKNVGPHYRTPIPEYKPITRNVLRGINLNHTVAVFCRDTFLIDGSTPNICVRQTTRGKMTHNWCGPIVAMRQPGISFDPRFYEDITAADLRVVVDYFLSYGCGSIFNR